jgi:hypothetical protein
MVRHNRHFYRRAKSAKIPPWFREPNPQVQWTWPLSPPSNLVGIASDLANLADLAVANLLRSL